MTVQTVAAYLQAASHPARTWRRMNRSIMGGRGGVVPTTPTFTDLQVTQRGAGANMSVDVAEGTAMVMGTESNYQGLYHCDNQGVQNVVITAANVTNPRRDLIVARVKDTEYGVAVTDVFALEAIAGTPAGSPADPTVPDNCIVLARVAVAANASSITNANITDLRNNYAAVTGSALIGNQQKAAAGGIAPCLSTSRPTTGLYEGLVIYETDTHITQVYTGAAWTWYGSRGLVGHGASGSDQTGIVATPVDVTGATTGSITIPAGRNIRVEAFGGVYKGVSDTSSWAQLAIMNGGSTLGSSNTYVVGPTTYTHAYCAVVLKGTLSGTVTIKAQMSSSNAAPAYINTQAGFYVAVADMGPT